MAQRIIRRMEYGEILDEMFHLYKTNFLLFAGLSAVLTMPMTILNHMFVGRTGTIVTLFLALPVNLLVVAATTWAVSRVYLGKQATIVATYKAALCRFPALVVTFMLAGLLIYTPVLIAAVLSINILPSLTVLFILAGVVGTCCLVFWIVFISQVVMIEGLSSARAIGRSRQLAAGNWWRMFIVGFLTGIIGLIINGTFIMLGGPLHPHTVMHTLAGKTPGLLAGITDGIGSSLAAPIQVLAFVLLYYDIRVRKEGFDLELLAQSLGEPTQTVHS